MICVLMHERGREGGREGGGEGSPGFERVALRWHTMHIIRRKWVKSAPNDLARLCARRRDRETAREKSK